MSDYQKNNQPAVAYDWDSTIENDGTSFELLPPGIYSFVVSGMERGYQEATEKSIACNVAILTLDVQNAEASGQITDRLFLNSRNEWKLCQFFCAIGQRKKGDPLKMNWEKVPGSRGTLEINHRKFNGRNGNEQEANNVKAYLERQDAPQAAAFKPGAF